MMTGSVDSLARFRASQGYQIIHNTKNPREFTCTLLRLVSRLPNSTQYQKSLGVHMPLSRSLMSYQSRHCHAHSSVHQSVNNGPIKHPILKKLHQKRLDTLLS